MAATMHLAPPRLSVVNPSGSRITDPDEWRRYLSGQWVTAGSAAPNSVGGESVIWVRLGAGSGTPSEIARTLHYLYVSGAEIDWSTFERWYRRRRVLMPTYPFQRRRYWYDDATADS